MKKNMPTDRLVIFESLKMTRTKHFTDGLKERGKKVTDILQDPRQKKVFKENRSQNKVDGKQGENRKG